MTHRFRTIGPNPVTPAGGTVATGRREDDLMIRPGEYVGWGLGIAVFGGVLALAAALADAVELLWIAVPAVVVGGVMARIGTVAWGVRVGIRASRLDQ